MTDVSGTAAIVRRFQRSLSEAPKHARVRAAIVDAIQSGDVGAGTKMIGERELSECLGVSLGTVQKALGRLVHDGFLVRRQGHGTFVGHSRRPVEGSWHYRFVEADDGAELPVFTTILDRRLIREQGPWSRSLGADRRGFVMLYRRLDIGGKFACASRMYLPATRFARLLRVAISRLSDINLKMLLERDFDAPTLRADGIAHLVLIDDEDAKVIGIAPAGLGLQVDVVGRTFEQRAITYQRMIVPPSPYGMKLDFNSPAPH